MDSLYINGIVNGNELPNHYIINNIIKNDLTTQQCSLANDVE